MNTLPLRRFALPSAFGEICTAFMCLVMLTLFLYPAALPAEESGPRARSTESSETLLFPLTLFRKFVSPVDGERCAMVPSCSGYALDAFHKHGFILGWIMTSDRLMRCGRDEFNHAAPLRLGRKVYALDPVENNDFWLKER